MNKDFIYQQSTKNLKDDGNNIIYLSDPSEVSMDDEWFDLANKDHFWMRWRFSLIRKYVDALSKDNINILEVGCGNGINMQMFESELGLTIDGCDLNEIALKKIKDVHGKKYLYNIFDYSHQMLDKYDVILLLDVIEHIENDSEFIETALKCLKINGSAIISVPAHHILFCKYDKLMGHVRRYNKKELKTLLTNLGLQIEYITYWGLFLVPVLFLRKFILIFTKKGIAEIGFRSPNPIINNAFLSLMKIENKLFTRPIIGTSLFVAVKKIRD